jgi:hypothetical protein
MSYVKEVSHFERPQRIINGLRDKQPNNTCYISLLLHTSLKDRNVSNWESSFSFQMKVKEVSNTWIEADRLWAVFLNAYFTIYI